MKIKVIFIFIGSCVSVYTHNASFDWNARQCTHAPLGPRCYLTRAGVELHLLRWVGSAEDAAYFWTAAHARHIHTHAPLCKQPWHERGFWSQIFINYTQNRDLLDGKYPGPETKGPGALFAAILLAVVLWYRTSHPAVPIPSRENYSLKGQSSRTMCTAMQPPPVDGCFFIELDFLESVFARSFQLRSSLQGAKCFYKYSSK